MKTVFDDFAIHRYHEDIHGKDNAFYSGSFRKDTDNTVLAFTVSCRDGLWTLEGMWLEDSKDFSSANEAYEFLESEIERLEEENSCTYFYPKESKTIPPDCLSRYRWDDISASPVNSTARLMHLDAPRYIAHIRVFHEVEGIQRYTTKVEIVSKDDTVPKGLEYSFVGYDVNSADRSIVSFVDYLNNWLKLDLVMPSFRSAWEPCESMKDTLVATFDKGRLFITKRAPLYEAKITLHGDRDIAKASFNTESEAKRYIDNTLRELSYEA